MTQYEERKKALEILRKIDERPEEYIIIHYTCDNFKISQTITSIAVRQLHDGQTESFSLYKSAQFLHIPENKMNEKLPEIEKKMLTDYFSFVKKHPKKIYIHWNMSTDNYGFKGLEDRFRVLGGRPTQINDEYKIDLSNTFIRLYGKGYAKHPRLENLMKKNHISHPNDFLPGFDNDPSITDEPDAFHTGKYKLLQMSCLRKVDIFNNFLNLAINKQLKVYTPWWTFYGSTLRGKLAALNERWWFKILTYFGVAFVGYIFNSIMDHLFTK